MASKYAFAQAVRELRFHFCQTSEQSAAARSFIHRAYPTMKKNNPNIPILIREASGIEPRVFARYEYGREQLLRLKDLSDKEIEDQVTKLVREGI